MDSEVKEVFADMKMRHLYPWLIFSITARKDRIVVETKGKPGQGYSEFLQALKASGEPRYALFESPKEWSRDKTTTKICFISW